MTDRNCCDGLCEQGRSCPYRECLHADRLASAEARLFCGGGGSDGLRGHPRHVGADLAVGVVGMTAQPEALRLAALLDAHQFDEPHEAAAELRRLHAQRDALLEALKKAEENGCATVYSNEDDECGDKGSQQALEALEGFAYHGKAAGWPETITNRSGGGGNQMTQITIDRALVEQGLETIEGLTRDRLFTAEWAGKHGATIAALRTALAQPPRAGHRSNDE
jgi:hypothetical protein